MPITIVSCSATVEHLIEMRSRRRHEFRIGPALTAIVEFQGIGDEIRPMDYRTTSGQTWLPGSPVLDRAEVVHLLGDDAHRLRAVDVEREIVGAEIGLKLASFAKPATSRFSHARAARAKELLISSPMSLNGRRFFSGRYGDGFAGRWLGGEDIGFRLSFKEFSARASAGCAVMIFPEERVSPTRRAAKGFVLNDRRMIEHRCSRPSYFMRSYAGPRCIRSRGLRICRRAFRRTGRCAGSWHTAIPGRETRYPAASNRRSPCSGTSRPCSRVPAPAGDRGPCNGSFEERRSFVRACSSGAGRENGVVHQFAEAVAERDVVRRLANFQRRT